MLIYIILICTNVLSFSLMAIDKLRAKTRRWRIPERTLFLSAACFGALGGTLGMFLFHHKTRHWYFRLFFPLMLIIQAAIVLLLEGQLPL